MGLLSLFVKDHVDAIVAAWEAVAPGFPPPPRAAAAPALALRDHARGILVGIADGMDRPHSNEPPRNGTGDAWFRAAAGLDPARWLAEFHALRNSVMAAWRASGVADAASASTVFEEVMRFDAGLDQVIAESARRHAGGLAASRDMFLAVLADDARAPLVGIDMSAVLLSKPALAEAPRQQAAARVRRASRDIARLAADLAAYAHIRLGPGIPLQMSGCDVGRLCDECADTLRAAHPGRSFTQRLGGDLRIVADEPRLRHALSNLLHHAAQHGDARKPLTMSAEGGRDMVRLTIGYRGGSIPAQALPGLFEPQAPCGGEGVDPEGGQPRQSRGLGLFIAREIVLGHGGAVEVESTSALGTVFTLRLPRGPAG